MIPELEDATENVAVEVDVEATGKAAKPVLRRCYHVLDGTNVASLPKLSSIGNVQQNQEG